LARFLALDWDHQELRVVAASVGRGGVHVQRAVVWQEQLSPNPAEPATLGQTLRERLKSTGIAPAPVLACVGRDRVIVKEVRYPAVPLDEEPAIVRFQAIKELADPAEEVVIDYVPAGEAVGPTGERLALILVVRRELLAAYQEICRVAGVKLLALTPRPFGILACLQHATPTAAGEADAARAVLTLADHWAELCVVRGDRLLFARTLTTGTGLAGEVRRNLLVYAGQFAQYPVRALYVAGESDQSAFQRLGEQLGVSVRPLDPFRGVQRPDLPESHRGAYAPAVGLLEARAAGPALSVNFVRPKQPKPKRDPNTRKALMAAGIAAVALVALAVFCYVQLAAKEREIEALTLERMNLDNQLVQVEEDAQRIKALDDWTQGNIDWLDELYDITACFPDTNNIRLIVFNGSPLSTTARDKHVAHLGLEGITTEDGKVLRGFMAPLNEDSHYRVETTRLERNRQVEQFRFRQKFSTQVDIEKQPPDKYVRHLPPPPEDSSTRGRGESGEEGPGFFGGPLP
jgi:hypothetical protein